MNLLLDTHTFLWFIDGNSRLSTTARTLIEEPTNSRFLSLASLWEMAIKVSMGRLTFTQPFAPLLIDQLQRNRITLLDILFAHTVAVSQLPFHHRDPFDRMLIAQAIVEQMPIISIDSVFDTYPVTRLW